MKSKKFLAKVIAAALLLSAPFLPITEIGGIATISEAAKLSAPTVQVSSTTVSSVTLKWNKVSGASKYRVYKYDASSKKYAKYKDVSKTSCMVTDLSKGSSYKFKVAALTKSGSTYKEQKKSAAVTAKTSSSASLQTADFTVYDKSGKEHRLSDFAGKPIVVNVWATWCGPCVSELPGFQSMYEKYGKKVQFLMVNCEDQSQLSQVKSFLGSEYTFPVYYDWEYSASNAYKIDAIPRTIVINKNGEATYDAAGSMSEDALEELIKEVL